MVSLIKRGIKAFARTNIASRIVTHLEASADRRTNLLRVLTYHRIDWPDTSAHLYPNTLSSTPSEFRWQAEYLANRYCIVDIHAVIAAIRGEHELPPKALLITFDDAYQDFWEHAWPTLRALSLPAVLFVPTAFPSNRDAAFWWDRLHQAAIHADALATAADLRRFRALVSHVKALPHSDALTLVDEYCRDRESRAENKSPVMTWEQLRQLTKEGLDLAAHTCTHPLMTRISVEEAVHEATQSRKELCLQTHADLPVFAYPGGAYSQSLLQPLDNAGFEVAFTTRRGLNDLRTASPLLLDRINVSVATPRTAVRAQLLSGMRHATAFAGR
ncbi:MAG: polysaccharide deacetylase family protein [Planctomycetes bacterium]|nr:polysaccharide deacetylase family protein [Planctomycetota bacterium]